MHAVAVVDEVMVVLVVEGGNVLRRVKTEGKLSGYRAYMTKYAHLYRK